MVYKYVVCEVHCNWSTLPAGRFLGQALALGAFNTFMAETLGTLAFAFAFPFAFALGAFDTLGTSLDSSGAGSTESELFPAAVEAIGSFLERGFFLGAGFTDSGVDVEPSAAEASFLGGCFSTLVSCEW